jgi:hypothetical protein
MGGCGTSVRQPPSFLADPLSQKVGRFRAGGYDSVWAGCVLKCSDYSGSSIAVPRENNAEWLFTKKKPPRTKLTSVCELENRSKKFAENSVAASNRRIGCLA